MRFFKVYIFAIMLMIFGCKSSELSIERPVEKYNTFNFVPEPSTISLPVEIKVTSLEALLNKQLSGLLYEDNSLENNGGDNLMVKAWKKENISLSYDKGQFSYRVPLKLWIKAGWKIDKFGISLSDYREMNAEIALKFHSSVSVGKDWSVVTVTQSDGYEWLSKPTLKIGPIDLPITFIADMIIKYNMETINSAIDEGLQQSLDLKTNVASVWTEIQKPMLLSDEYGLWLRISPKTIGAMPLSGGKGIIRHTTVMQGVAECFTGKEPPSRINPVLPELSPVTKPNEGFIANVVSYIGYDYLDSITRRMLVNTSYTFGNKKITINNVAIYGNETKMIIATDVSGSIKGKLYFAGVPDYRSSDSSIILNDLKFSVQTQNVLLKSAAWLANSGIEKAISKNMIYPVGADLRETYHELEESIKKYELGEGFFISGILSGMDVLHPTLAPAGIIAPVRIKGKLLVTMD
jgi:hypothetical protein